MRYANGLNVYHYAVGNPVAAIDAFGLEAAKSCSTSSHDSSGTGGATTWGVDHDDTEAACKNAAMAAAAKDTCPGKDGCAKDVHGHAATGGCTLDENADPPTVTVSHCTTHCAHYDLTDKQKGEAKEKINDPHTDPHYKGKLQKGVKSGFYKCTCRCDVTLSGVKCTQCIYPPY